MLYLYSLCKNICSYNLETSTEVKNKHITAFSTDKYSRLAIDKTSHGPLDNLTMCWAASGTGDLLQYAGFSSISGRDIYIRIGKE